MTEKPIIPRPPIDLIVDFITQAEELAHGKRQVEVVAEIAQQFADLVDHDEALEKQLSNLKKAYTDLMRKFLQSSPRKLPSND